MTAGEAGPLGLTGFEGPLVALAAASLIGAGLALVVATRRRRSST